MHLLNTTLLSTRDATIPPLGCRAHQSVFPHDQCSARQQDGAHPPWQSRAHAEPRRPPTRVLGLLLAHRLQDGGRPLLGPAIPLLGHCAGRLLGPGTRGPGGGPGRTRLARHAGAVRSDSGTAHRARRRHRTPWGLAQATAEPGVSTPRPLPAPPAVASPPRPSPRQPCEPGGGATAEGGATAGRGGRGGLGAPQNHSRGRSHSRGGGTRRRSQSRGGAGEPGRAAEPRPGAEPRSEHEGGAGPGALQIHPGSGALESRERVRDRGSRRDLGRESRWGQMHFLGFSLLSCKERAPDGKGVALGFYSRPI